MSDESDRLRKFAIGVKKLGSMETAWSKIDKNSNGAVSAKEFIDGCSRFAIISNAEDAEKVFYCMIKDN